MQRLSEAIYSMYMNNPDPVRRKYIERRKTLVAAARLNFQTQYLRINAFHIEQLSQQIDWITRF